MKEVKIDYSKIVGKIKPMNGVNNGPAGSRTRKTGNFESYEALKIPYARLHDASFYFGNYGGEFTVDVHRVFPDFSADENDENSYIFAPTDSYLQDIEAVGTEVFYRLGASIEHGYKKGTYPPKDFEKWARICERIIRHYNEGWANGFYMNIKYWEIWNEPDCHNHDGSAPCWQGSEELFWDFYEVAAKYLKGKFPSLKIGGPAFTGAWCSWADRFLEEMGKRKVPMDFYSFHCYAKTPEVFVEMVDYAVEQINKFGYENAELILNEWNYVRGWTGDLFKYSLKSIKSLKGSAFASAVMLSCQKTPLSALMYYDARPCGYNGIFSTDGLEPLKTYYIFKNFAEIRELSNEAESEGSDNVYVVASRDGEKCGAMITRYCEEETDDEETVAVYIDKADISGSVKVEYYLTDENNDAALVKEEIFSSDKFVLYLKMTNYSTYFLRITKL